MGLTHNSACIGAFACEAFACEAFACSAFAVGFASGFSFGVSSWHLDWLENVLRVCWVFELDLKVGPEVVNVESSKLLLYEPCWEDPVD